MIIHEIIVKEKLKQNSTIAGHYLQSASKPNVSSLVVFGIKRIMKREEDAEFCTDGLLHVGALSKGCARKRRERSRVCPIFGVLGPRCIDDNFVKRTYDRRELRAQKERCNSDVCDSQVSITADYRIVYE